MGRGLKSNPSYTAPAVVNVAPYAGAWINERVPVGAGHLQTFLCERKITFFLHVLSMYLTVTDRHFSSFSGFFALFGGSRVEVGGSHLQTFLCERKISRRFYSPASQSQL